MKITVCGSMFFAEKLVEIYNKLKKMGHEPLVHENLFGVADGTAEEVKQMKNNFVEHSEIKKKYDYIRAWHKLIKESDAILICNFDRKIDGKKIKGYVGANSLMEVGFAHVNDKKIFLLNPVPDNFFCTDELKATVNVVLNGDLSRISD